MVADDDNIPLARPTHRSTGMQGTAATSCSLNYLNSISLRGLLYLAISSRWRNSTLLLIASYGSGSMRCVCVLILRWIECTDNTALSRTVFVVCEFPQLTDTLLPPGADARSASAIHTKWRRLFDESKPIQTYADICALRRHWSLPVCNANANPTGQRRAEQKIARGTF